MSRQMTGAEMVVEALKKGAFDFLEKPLTIEKVTVVVQNAAEKLRLEREVIRLRDSDASKHRIIGESVPMSARYVTRCWSEAACAEPSLSATLFTTSKFALGFFVKKSNVRCTTRATASPCRMVKDTSLSAQNSSYFPRRRLSTVCFSD